MENPNGRLHLWAFLQGIGFYPGGWRDQDATPAAVFDRAYYERVARTAEAGCFDAIVFGDQLQGRDAAGRTPGRLAIPTLDPFTLLSVMAGATSHIGLVATVSTTFNEPAEVAAKFAALDYLSGGRAGWNIVTTAHVNAALNFGETELLDKTLRYERAQAFLDATEVFWRSARDGKSNALQNAWFDFAGKLAMPCPPQGRPLIVQAGQSPDGRAFAAGSAEAIFCAAPTIEAGRDYRNDMRARITAAGRDPNLVKIMPGLAFILGSTEEEARTTQARMHEFADDALCIEYLSESIGYDLTVQAPDAPIPIEDIAATCEFPPADVRKMMAPAIESGRSLADFCRDYAGKPRGHGIFVGTPEQFADHMETWIDAEACDGFTLQPAFMPLELDVFCAEVVPILQQRGLLRKAYQGSQLRNHLGMAA